MKLRCLYDLTRINFGIIRWGLGMGKGKPQCGAEPNIKLLNFAKCPITGLFRRSCHNTKTTVKDVSEVFFEWRGC